ncbi:MAG: ImmA/IrrE family metallo-endopeptidase [Xenococcaceae cyanobacterium]
MDVIKPFQWLKKEEIENIASELRDRVKNNRKKYLKARSIAGAAADYLDLNVEWRSLPTDSKGEIAAMIYPTHKLILINENIEALKENESFEQSTIAHEIGHWILHINHQAIEEFKDIIDRGLEREIKPFLCRSSASSKGIEWQAQYFASCLLMPLCLLEEKIKGRDLTNWKHLYAIADEFGVTISNLINRLEFLNWIKLIANSKQIYLGQSMVDRK